MEHSYHIPHLLLLFDIETKAISLIKQIFNLMNQYKQVKERVKQNDISLTRCMRHVLTSSSCHPKVFVKEFCYFLMSCHQHGLGVNLLVQR